MGSKTETSQTKTEQVDPWAPASPYITDPGGILPTAKSLFDQFGTLSPDETDTLRQIKDLAGRQANDPAYGAARTNAAALASGQGAPRIDPVQGVQGQYINAVPTYDPSTIDRGSIRQVQSGPVSAEAIQGYESPYLNDVINQSLADIDRERQQTQMQNDAAAQAAGAFGGSRHGVLGALTNQDYANTEAQATANLRNQGFQTALSAAQADAGRRLAADTTNAGFDYNTAAANAAARNTAGQFNAGQALDTSKFNITNDANLNEFNRNLQLSNNAQALTAAQERAALSGQGIDQLNSIYGTQQSDLGAILAAQQAPGTYALDQLANYVNTVYPAAGLGRTTTTNASGTETKDDPLGAITGLMKFAPWPKP